MNTKMTGFTWLSKIFASLYLDESTLSTERVKPRWVIYLTHSSHSDHPKGSAYLGGIFLILVTFAKQLKLFPPPVSTGWSQLNCKMAVKVTITQIPRRKSMNIGMS